MYKKILPFVIAFSIIATPASACIFKKKHRAHAAPATHSHTLRHGDHWRNGPGWGRGPSGGEIIGGIVIGNAISSLLFPPPPPPAPPPPPPEAPPPPEPTSVVLDPFTGPWYEYCAGKYKSFDAKTGTWTDNDGGKHFCQ